MRLPDPAAIGSGSPEFYLADQRIDGAGRFAEVAPGRGDAPRPNPREAALGGAGIAASRYSLPAEFETQRGLLIGCHEMVDSLPGLFADLIEAARPHAAVVALVNNVDEWGAARRVLQRRGIPSVNVHFAEVPHDTMWVRDYGPMIVRDNQRRPAALNAAYDSFTRIDDDAVPAGFALAARLPVVPLPLRIDGGNLLVNGRGLGIATQNLVDDNFVQGWQEHQVREMLERYYGISQLVELEPLVGEPTGHIDMFTTFVSPDSVVVGRLDRAADPINAEILDRNAERLASVFTPNGPLRVERIPMPSHADGVWRSYTNVVYLDGAVLVPSYRRVDPQGSRAAEELYARSFPQRRIRTIDAESVAKLGGALHCVTMNLGPIGRLPAFPAPRRHRIVEQLPGGQVAVYDGLPAEHNADNTPSDGRFAQDRRAE